MDKPPDLRAVTADRLVQHLEAAGFVVMRKPPARAPTASKMPKSGG